MDDERYSGTDVVALVLDADDFLASLSQSRQLVQSDEEFLAWVESNPGPAFEDVVEVEPAPRRRRQEFLAGIGGYRADIQGIQVAQIRWISAEVAAYTLQAPNELHASLQDRVFASEVALTLGITEPSAVKLIERAKILTSDRRATLSAVEDGRITLRHAEVITDEGLSLFAELQARFEREAILLAQRMTPAKLKPELLKLRERLQPTDAVERHRDALLDRKVCTTAGRDGMGELWAPLSGEVVVAIDAKLDAVARSMKNAGTDEGRTRAQLRADILVDLVLGDASGARAIRPVVFLTAPATTAVGGNAPGELLGQGPIDAETARELIELSETFYRVLISPSTGEIVDIDTSSRHIPESIRRIVTLRDGTCRFPGCNRQAVGLELDHVDEYANGGAHRTGNLIAMCKKHHQLKSLGGWDNTLAPDGVVTWTSPSGRIDTTYPANPIALPDTDPVRKPAPPPPDPLDEWWTPTQLAGPFPYRKGWTPDPPDDWADPLDV